MGTKNNKRYDFTARTVMRIAGYVEAESEEEAIKCITEGSIDEIYEEEYEEPTYDIKIAAVNRLKKALEEDDEKI